MSRAGPSLAVLRLVCLVLMLVAMGVGILVLGTDGVRDLLEDAGNSRWGIAAFVGLYILAVVMLMPGTIGTVTAGHCSASPSDWRSR